MTTPDGNLVRAARAGKPEAYAELAGRHLCRVFAVCLALLGDLTDAEDLTQEVLVQGFQKLDQLHDEERFGAWIGQVARNRSRDLLRRRSRRGEQPLTDAVIDRTPAPTDSFGDLRQALDRLPPHHRLPLLLYYFDGKDVQTVADELGLSLGGACTRLHRARWQLRCLLEEEEVTRHG